MTEAATAVRVACAPHERPHRVERQPGVSDRTRREWHAQDIARINQMESRIAWRAWRPFIHTTQKIEESGELTDVALPW